MPTFDQECVAGHAAHVYGARARGDDDDVSGDRTQRCEANPKPLREIWSQIDQKI